MAAVRPRKPTNDAEAICTAVSQPTMRFVPVKTEVQQAMLVSHRTRDFLVRQLTQLANAIRAHLGEFGLVVAKGIHNMNRLVAEAEAADLRPDARMPLDLLVGQFAETRTRIDAITADLRRAAPRSRTRRRGGCKRCLAWAPSPPASLPPRFLKCRPSARPAIYRRGWAFGPSLGRIAFRPAPPKPQSSGGKERLGAISKMGNRYIRRLLYLGAMGVISTRKRADPGEDWLGRMLGKKPLKVVAIALVNRMARQVWALLRTGDTWQAA